MSNEQGQTNCGSSRHCSADFTETISPLLREYRDRIEGATLRLFKRNRKALWESNHFSWESFARSVSQHIEHGKLSDAERIELTLRLREFEAALIRLGRSF